MTTQQQIYRRFYGDPASPDALLCFAVIVVVAVLLVAAAAYLAVPPMVRASRWAAFRRRWSLSRRRGFPVLPPRGDGEHP